MAGVLMEVLLLTFLCLLSSLSLASWEDVGDPRIAIGYGKLKGSRFRGNDSERDHFRLLEHHGDSLLVGARNMFYIIDAKTLKERQRLEWFSESGPQNLCQMKGKSTEECQNYIRILVRKNEGELLVCGTYSYSPRCREYILKDGGSWVVKEGAEDIPARGLCPYDPWHNSTAIYADGELYVGTVTDFSGTDPLIYRAPLRTEQYDLNHLNAPDFVSALDYGEHVYFFFRENAVEYSNCGKARYSRVGRVCKKDKGGAHSFTSRWTSFLKARLNCSIPGDFPFYFHHIQSTSGLVKGVYGEKESEVMYATMTTGRNELSGSGVCAFPLRAILDVFAGPFKEQATPDSAWIPVKKKKVPEPRPGQCVEDSRTLTDVTLNFVKSHPLMDEAVPNIFSRPLALRTSFRYRFTKIAVDPQVQTADGKAYDVLFVGTDDGRVLKAVNVLAYDRVDDVRSVVIEDLQVFPPGTHVENLEVLHFSKEDTPQVIAVSADEIFSFPVHRCSQVAKTCSDCVKLQDPYCGWDLKQGQCVAVSSGAVSGSHGVIQKVSAGVSSSCPDFVFEESLEDLTKRPTSSPASPAWAPGRKDWETNEIPTENDVHQQSRTTGTLYMAVEEDVKRKERYSSETFAIAVTTACVAALIVGFVSGYGFSRRCRSDDLDSSYADIRFPADGGLMNHHPHNHHLMNHVDAQPNINNKSINLVLNVPAKNPNGKNPNSAADNQPIQKVKKIYL